MLGTRLENGRDTNAQCCKLPSGEVEVFHQVLDAFRLSLLPTHVCLAAGVFVVVVGHCDLLDVVPRDDDDTSHGGIAVS